MLELTRFTGIVHHISPSIVVASRGRRLYRSLNDGESWECCGNVPVSGRWHLVRFGRLARRAARATVWHVLPVDEALWVVLAFGGVFRWYPDHGAIERIGTIAGSRPLRVCVSGRTLLYGEYRSNEQRDAIAVWACDLDSGVSQVVMRLNGIRHIHGVFRDPCSDAIWMTTGDENSESSIGTLDIDTGSFAPVATGSQQTRAVDLLFTNDAIWFGSDAPDQVNHIYRLDRRSCAIEQVQQVGGPVFYGARCGATLVFSTAVEPGMINRSRSVELWIGRECGRAWQIVDRRYKDRWPDPLFQHGQFLIPSVSGDPGKIWVTPFAVAGDQVSLALQL